MIHVERFVNELMSSNCFLVWDDIKRHCIVIDPGSEKSCKEIQFIDSNHLVLDYVILTHEHTDHTWGCNALLNEYEDVKVVCSRECSKNLEKEGSAYFQYYYNDVSYRYKIKHIDILVEDIHCKLEWNDLCISFYNIPGHSKGSICFRIEENLFTGDTIMQYKPYINKRGGGSRVDYENSINFILSKFLHKNIRIYPGHGVMFYLDEFKY